MSAPTLHLKGFEPGSAFSLREQATSVAAEIAAADVFEAAARSDYAAGDLRALARIDALAAHKEQLRAHLERLERAAHAQKQPQQPH